MNNKLNNRKIIKLYWSAALFSNAELSYNLKLATLLNKYHSNSIFAENYDLQFLIPQLSPQESAGTTPSEIAKNDLNLCKQSNGGIFLVDLADVDSGCAIEYAYIRYALQLPTLLLRTDFRDAERNSKINCMFREEGEQHIYHEINGIEFYLKNLSDESIIYDLNKLQETENNAYLNNYIPTIHALIAKLFFI